MIGSTTVALLATLTLASQSQTPPNDPVIEVTGSAEVTVPPDRARLVFAVETEGESAEEARERNAALMESVLASVRVAGGPAIEVETFQYQLVPRYRRPSREPSDEPEIVGYRAVNHVRTTTDEPGTVGRLIDAAVAGGANRVTSVRFEVRDPATARSEALREAVGRARGEAELIAEALGVTLGSPLEVRGGAEQPGPGPFAAREFMLQAEAMDTPVEPGRQTISASVTIRFRIDEPL